MLLVAPFALGMPHLPAEAREFLRCLLIPRGALLAVLAPLLVLLGLRSAECMGYRRPANSDVLLGCLAVLTAALYRPGSALQRLQRGLLELGLCMIACHFANTTTLVRAYAHYLLAPWFFACWVRPGQQSRTLRPLSMGVLAGLGLLLLVPPGSAGALDQTIWNAGEFFQSVREAFAPGVSAEMSSRVVLVYTFAQLLLYAVWLHVLPHKSTDKAAPRGPGLWAIAAILLLAVPLAVYLTNPITVRDRSLTLASFHDWVELSLLAYCGIALRAGATVPILVAATAPAAQHSMVHVA